MQKTNTVTIFQVV